MARERYLINKRARAFKRKRLWSLFDHMDDGYVESDNNRKIYLINRTILKIFGYDSHNELIGRDASILYYNKEEERALIETLEKDERVIGREILGVKSDGSPLYLSFNAQFQYDSKGRRVGVQAKIRDISEKRREEIALIETNKRLESIIESTSDFIWSVESEKFGLIDFNRAYVNYIETFYHHKTEVGDTPEILDSENCSIWIKFYQRALDEGSFDTEYRTKQSNRTLLLSFNTIKEGGKSFAISVFAKDISRQKEEERAKAIFIANLSHEIKTPLGTILGFSDLLLDSTSSEEEKREFALLIKENGENLKRLMENLLHTSKFESGELSLTREYFIPCLILDKLYNEEQKLNRESTIELRIVIPPEREKCVIYNDRYKIEQILRNFLNNSLKFTERGFIELGCYRELEEIVLYVKDSGIGIPNHFKSQLFTRFRQLDSGKNRRYGGTGLGLSISKELAQLIGGKLSFESTLGEGSTFYLKLPIN